MMAKEIEMLPSTVTEAFTDLMLWATSSLNGVAQAKNGGELFWEEKIHAANGKAQAHT